MKGSYFNFCHDIQTTEKEFVFKSIGKSYVVYSIQIGVNLNQGHYMKGNHTISKHAFLEIVKTTKIWAFKNKLQRVHR